MTSGPSTPHGHRRQDMFLLLGIGISLLALAYVSVKWLSPLVLAGIWAATVVAIVGAAMLLVLIANVRERRTRKLVAREKAARDRAVQARRETDWQEQVTEWLGADFASLPVLSHDPERLGGAS